MTNKDLSFDNMERLGLLSPDHKSSKRYRQIWLCSVLLCKSERESDFDIFGCTSECETIRLAISLVCLICNISLLRETWRLVALRLRLHPQLLWESRSRSSPKGLDGSAVKMDLSLGRSASTRSGVPFQAFSLRALRALPRLFCLTRRASCPD